MHDLNLPLLLLNLLLLHQRERLILRLHPLLHLQRVRKAEQVLLDKDILFAEVPFALLVLDFFFFECRFLSFKCLLHLILLSSLFE